MTIVKSTLLTPPATVVTARLQASSAWTKNHQEQVSPITTTSDDTGAWQLDLPPQSTYKDVLSCWRIEHKYATHLVVVPDAGPVFVDDIEVAGPALDPAVDLPTFYVARSELAAPGGVATLGPDGILLAAQRPAGGGGSAPDATTTSKGVVQLAGDLAGTAVAPTVPGLAAKYVKPGGGIPSSDLSAAVQASLSKADASATDADLDALAAVTASSLAAKADAAATTSALAGKAAKPRVVATYVTTGNPAGDVPPGTGGGWAKYAGVGELVVPASVGDFLEVDLAFVTVADSGSIWDVGVLVGTSIVWTSSSGTATPSGDGDPGLAPFAAPVRPFMSAAGWLVVESGHLDGGNVRFVLLSNSSGGGKIFHATSNPFRWKAENRGPVS